MKQNRKNVYVFLGLVMAMGAFLIFYTFSIAGSQTLGIAMDGEAQAVFHDRQGNQVGVAVLKETVEGVLIRVSVEGVSPGEHAIHIHEKGACTPASVEKPTDVNVNEFDDAGSHLNPEDKEHGFLNENGPHAGDLPPLFVAGDGSAEAAIYNDRISIEGADGKAALLDDDGAALIIHDGPDDYMTDPTGNAGTRIACTEIKER